MQCPLNCKKVTALTSKISDFVLEKTQRSRDELLFQQITESIFKITNEGHQILWTGKNGSSYYVIFMFRLSESTYDSTRLIYLCTLPYRDTRSWCAIISLEYKGCCQAHIGEIEARPQRRGYGSILMEHTLSYLRSAGFQTVTGIISPADFGHEEMLRHFYGKFGFEITNYPNERHLHLDLFDEKTPTLEKDGITACCRSAGYQLLKSEAMLAEADAE